MLQRANDDLEKRLHEATQLRGRGEETFSVTQMRATVAQVKDTLRSLTTGMKGLILDQGQAAVTAEVSGTLRYLNAAEREFRGVNQRLQLPEAGILDTAQSGVETSLLRRIATDPSHPGHVGVLNRYGANVIGNFEQELQLKLLARKPWDEVRAGLVEQSPFLQGAPAHWAERIVRTESMYASNRAGWEATRAANSELGDMVKILCATFDDRTGSDSIAVHGQIRRPNEAFESWFGAYQHPPNRPNDRETVVPHRISWPIPDTLKPRSDGEVAARWFQEKRKGAPPGRPLMSTVDVSLFGRQEPPKLERKQPELPQQAAPQPEVIAPAEGATPIASPEVVSSSPAPVAPEPSEPQAPEAQAERPRVLPRFRNEAARRRYAEGQLDQLPRLPPEEAGDDIIVRHRFETKSEAFDEATRDRLESIANDLRKLEKADEAPLPRNVRIEDLIATQPDVRSVHVLEDINRTNAPVPVVVRQGGKLYVQEGLETLVARDLAGHRTAPVHIINLDTKTPFKARPKPPAPTPPPAEEEKGIPVKKVPAKDYVEHLKKYVKGRPKAVEVFGDVAKHAQQIFGEHAPTLETLESTWGCEHTGHTVQVQKVSSSHWGATVEIQYEGAIMREGREVGSIIRTFKKHPTGRFEVHHDYFKLDVAGEQGKGLGESMMRQAIQTYDKIGVHDVTVDAAWIGRYTWASFGYNWDAEEASNREFGLWNYLKDKGIERDRAARIAKQVAHRAWDVAGLDVDGIRVEAMVNTGGKTKLIPDMTVGKAFMLDKGMWSGKLVINNKNDPSYLRAKSRLKL
jgi:hypothetical protein